jgi:hypothetical protein
MSRKQVASVLLALTRANTAVHAEDAQQVIGAAWSSGDRHDASFQHFLKVSGQESENQKQAHCVPISTRGDPPRIPRVSPPTGCSAAALAAVSERWLLAPHHVTVFAGR